jgi:acetyl esterase/lipase
LHLIKEAGLPMPACAVLLSPGTDLTMSGKSVVTNERMDPMFMLQGLIIMRGSYAPEQFMAEPAASPLFADYEGFPPLHFVVGSTEILLDDSTRAVEKARRAGVETELRIWRGMPHVFPSFPFLPEARGATDDIVRFISRNTAWEEMPD